MFRPLRAGPVADRLPALRRRLQAHPARLPHWAGNREEASAVGSPREQSQDDPVTSRKVSASPGRKSDMRFSLTAPSPESTLTRVRAHAYTHADRPRDAGTRGGKGASPPACATAVRAQTPGVRTGPRPRRATWSGGGEGVGGVRGPKTARGIIGFLMGLLSSCGVGENQKGAERWLARLWIGVGCVHVELREIRQWE